MMQRMTFSLPGGEGGAKRRVGRARRADAAAPTRLTLRVSHPPRSGEGDLS